MEIPNDINVAVVDNSLLEYNKESRNSNKKNDIDVLEKTFHI